jgi:hypothetical protein
VKHLKPGKVGACILISKKGESFRVRRGEVVVSKGTKYLVDTKIVQEKGGVQKLEMHSFGPGTKVTRLSSIRFETGVAY